MNSALTQSSKAYRYKAFISYRHSDNQEQDREWASWLHTRLETWQIPPELIGTLNGRGERIPESLYPVFRDEQSLPADADLASGLQNAIEQSSVLVVLCSPRAVQSTYVEQEIRHFQRLGRQNRIIGAIVDGEPNASRNSNKVGHECFPEPLIRGLTAEGEVEFEPLAADLRFEGKEGFTRPERVRELLVDQGISSEEARRRARVYSERLELAFLKIVAGIIGVPLEDLVKRDHAYQLKLARRRTRMLLSVAFSLLALTLVSLWQWNEANQNRQKAFLAQRDAEKRASRTEFERAKSNAIRSSGIALPFLSSALELDSENEAAALALDATLRRFPHMLPVLPVRQAKENVARIAVSRERGEIAAVHESGKVMIWAKASEKPIAEFEAIKGEGLHLSLSDDVPQILLWGKNRAEEDHWESEAGIWDTNTGARLAAWKSSELEILEAKWIPAVGFALCVRKSEEMQDSGGAHLIVLNHQGEQLWASQPGILFAEALGGGRTITTICSDDAARWFDAVSGKMIREVRFSEKLNLHEYRSYAHGGVRQIGCIALERKHETVAISLGNDLGTTSDGLSQGSSGKIVLIHLSTGEVLQTIDSWHDEDEIDFYSAKNDLLSVDLPISPSSDDEDEIDIGGEERLLDNDLANSIAFDSEGSSLVATLHTKGKVFIQLKPQVRVTTLPNEPLTDTKVDTEQYFRGADFLQNGSIFYAFCHSLRASGRSAEQVPYVQFWRSDLSLQEGNIQEICLPLQDQDRLRQIATGFDEDSVFVLHQSGAIVEYMLHQYNPPSNHTNVHQEAASIPVTVSYKPEMATMAPTEPTLTFDFQESRLPYVEMLMEAKIKFSAELDTIWEPVTAAMHSQQNVLAIAGTAGKYDAAGLELFRIQDGKRQTESIRTTIAGINRVAFSPRGQLLAVYGSYNKSPSLATVLDVATGESIPSHEGSSFEQSLADATANASYAIKMSELLTGQRRTARGLERISWRDRSVLREDLQSVLTGQ